MALAFTAVDLLAGPSLIAGTVVADLVMSTDHKETRSTEQPQDFLALPVPSRYSARFRFILGSRWVPSHGRDGGITS